MTPDIHFNRWMKRAIALFLIIFAYLVIADVTIPMTSYATLQRPVLSIAPQVTGKVVEVAVHNNQHVQKGDLLFKIDDSDYALAVREAELLLQQAHQSNQTLKANIAEEDAKLASANVTFKENNREYQRLRKLQKQHVISDQQVEQAQTQVQASQANLKAIEARKNAILIALGDDELNNIDVNNAQNSLDNARLNLSRTAIYAPQDGVISNMQLVSGMVTQSNQPLLSLVVTGYDQVTADFREKSITNVQPGTAALIVYDAFPGQLFEAELVSRDYGIAQGQSMANGVLATPNDSDRWVRDAQRIRVYIQQKGEVPNSLVSGSKATVMLESSDSAVFRFIGHLQMRIVSLLHYVY
ncbi:Multidrug resistance protein MdtN [Marinomonas gallaica]|uniref:Multidrug resistance protein MdtN n=1 Tax=Marinomonas gallaica TaxID=1806667 RepID=A0A1C3JTB3_9GAMM|nr:HlyD family secretion protein [Marinomonas gallaica]SBT18461.1 Multidrug resistance protein MdtN [Marinomonas gallaica]SBT22663.1 Multidrug resistance protein MdtN [Marinomonas gallaica]